MNKIQLNIKSPWALLISLCMGAALMTVVAFADDEVIGYTYDGHPVLESEVGDDIVGQALGLRQLDIEIKDIKKIDTEVLSDNEIKLVIDEDKSYNIIFGDCVLNEIDNFQFQTRGDGSLDVGDFAIVRRNPFKYFDNPNLELSKEQVEVKLKNWDIDVRACTIAGISVLEEIEVPVPTEDIRG